MPPTEEEGPLQSPIPRCGTAYEGRQGPGAGAVQSAALCTGNCPGPPRPCAPAGSHGPRGTPWR
eukprot:10821312-Alexandrium_andersonii.AAC.1